MFCSKCGTALPEDSAFCPKCGNRIVPQAATPQVDGTRVTDSSSPVDVPMASQNAAKSLAAQPETKVIHPADIDEALQQPGKSRFIYQLLAFFIGALGVHNFYAGRIRSACGQLLLLLLAFIGGVAGAVMTEDPSVFVVVPLLILQAWVVVEIFAVHCDGKGRPFASSSLPAAIDENKTDEQTIATLSDFRRKMRIAIVVMFFAPLLAILAGNMFGNVAIIGIGFFVAVVAIGAAWYYYARSKGYNVPWSLGLAISGFIGTVTIPIGLLLPAITFSIAKRLQRR